MYRKRILWIVSWYPNRKDKFDGDFIQRHARAAAIHHDIHVIFVTDLPDLAKKELLIDTNAATGLTEEIIYFKTPKGPLSRFRKQWRWFRLYKKAVIQNFRQYGRPDLVHVHVPWKAGLVALWLCKKFHVRFIISEHWGIYNKVIPLNYYERSTFFQKTLQQIFSNSVGFTTVSRYLADSILDTNIKKDYTIIPNVVDTTLFFHKRNDRKPFTFIHVSNMVYLKNVDGILEAFGKLIETGIEDVRLVMAGNKDQHYPEMAANMRQLHKKVFFKGEISYREVAELMQESNCFILNSLDETASCVVSEALCCGLPVIATAVGGVPELINNSNSFTVPVNDSDRLALVMHRMIDEYDKFDQGLIAWEAAETYSYAAISDKFNDLYNTVVR